MKPLTYLRTCVSGFDSEIFAGLYSWSERSVNLLSIYAPRFESEVFWGPGSEHEVSELFEVLFFFIDLSLRYLWSE